MCIVAIWIWIVITNWQNEELESFRVIVAQFGTIAVFYFVYSFGNRAMRIFLPISTVLLFGGLLVRGLSIPLPVSSVVIYLFPIVGMVTAMITIIWFFIHRTRQL